MRGKDREPNEQAKGKTVAHHIFSARNMDK